MTNDEGIQYPYAMSKDGVVHASEAERDADYTCLGCDSKLVLRAGPHRRPHFAHLGTECCPESARHLAFKYRIVESQNAAARRGTPYLMSATCTACGDVVTCDIAQNGFWARPEHSGVEGVRTDVWVGGPRRSLAIEIVATHDLEPTTLARYRAAATPVLRIGATWESFEQLSEGCSGEFVNNPRCKGCQRRADLRRRIAEACSNVRAQVRALGESWLAHLRSRAPLDSFRTWAKDRVGNEMFAWTRRTVHSHGRALVRAGFRQDSHKPYLFYVKFPSGGTLYADLGGNAIEPIWQSKMPTLYTFGCSTALLDVPRDFPESIDLKVVLTRVIERAATKYLRSRGIPFVPTKQTMFWSPFTL